MRHVTSSAGRVGNVLGLGLAAVLLGSMVAGWALPSEQPDPASDERLAPLVTRISGADRYAMAATVARQTRPAGADVVYVASGANYPDALSAGPAAVHDRGALLLVPPDGVPAATEAALAALSPTRVIVVGGTASISDAVIDRLGAIVPRATVTRLAGPDRYAVSRIVVGRSFAGGADAVLVATGANFPDALSAGSVAGAVGVPVLLVDGGAGSVDATTRSFFTALRPSLIALVGGTSSVTAGVESSLGGIAPVQRVSGADRYAVSLAMNDFALLDFSTVYLATGAGFPDALAGGVLAGTVRAPLYVVPPDCVPAEVLARLGDRGTRTVVLLGGPASLGAGVEALRPCS